jgi:hypothetical protein
VTVQPPNALLPVLASVTVAVNPPVHEFGKA